MVDTPWLRSMTVYVWLLAEPCYAGGSEGAAHDQDSGLCSVGLRERKTNFSAQDLCHFWGPWEKDHYVLCTWLGFQFIIWHGNGTKQQKYSPCLFYWSSENKREEWQLYTLSYHATVSYLPVTGEPENSSGLISFVNEWALSTPFLPWPCKVQVSALNILSLEVLLKDWWAFHEKQRDTRKSSWLKAQKGQEQNCRNTLCNLSSYAWSLDDIWGHCIFWIMLYIGQSNPHNLHNLTHNYGTDIRNRDLEILLVKPVCSEDMDGCYNLTSGGGVIYLWLPQRQYLDLFLQGMYVGYSESNAAYLFPWKW